MNEKRYRLYEYMTRTKWLHVEDALSIGKLRLFAIFNTVERKPRHQ